MLNFNRTRINKIEQLPAFFDLLRWLLISLIIGTLAGSASAILLLSLEWATSYRESHLWIIALLPVAGLIIGLMYHYWGGTATKGNNILIDEVHNPKDVIPLRMAPLVYIGTVLTHLFGGSAGREGTAVQIGGAIADGVYRLLKLSINDRRIMIMMGVSAGFASVFGTPLAGAVFALEVLIIGRMRYEAILPVFLVAFVANYTCSQLWGIEHTHYSIPYVPHMDIINLLYAIGAGILFGLTAMLFSRSIHFWSKAAAHIKYPPLRPLLGGVAIALFVWLSGSTKYIGLGVPTIVESFQVQQEWYGFLLKILLTGFTIGVGFKGGEVTPLFFIGATLGSVLFMIIPLPMALLAGMGFVAVFAGATNTPIACILMGIELFGADAAAFIAVACIVAYLFSGHSGIYSSQIIGSPKTLAHKHLKGQTLSKAEKK